MSAVTPLLYDYPGSICCQMARLTLAEKGVAYEKRTVDIMDKAEQFEPWYTALNPKAVVPTLALGDEIVCDTFNIVARVDADFPGPPLTPEDPAERQAMEAMMRAVMGLHYGVLLYSKRVEPDGSAPIVVARGAFLRAERARHPERAAALDRRIAGNERLQKILADPAEVERHIGTARSLVETLDAALAEHLFVAAAHYTLADAFATAALARFRIHGFAPWWSAGQNPNVAGYYKRMKARPSWSAAGVVDSDSEHDL
jgi:glutathione S-transferase